MARVLRNKNLATKFQILVEIAANQPNIQQKLIASNIGVTPQAISDYISQLIKDNLIASDGRSRYTVTKEGVDWILGLARELKDYSAFVEKAITNISVCTAIAETQLSRDQFVGLKMKNGLLFASDDIGNSARGIAVSDAAKGSDVGISNIEGIVNFQKGYITIIEIPDIAKGGSCGTNLKQLAKLLPSGSIIGAIGLESLSALRMIEIEPQYFYGVEAAIIEAARSGLSPIVVCVDDQIPALTQRLQVEKLDYRILDSSKSAQ